jgi:16S rRNA (cytosine967-C5)-methyltransferase
LEDAQIETSYINKIPDALSLGKRVNLRNHEYYKQGFFEIQDAGSQAIAPFLQAEPGMYVIDACAGGGGKTLHLAALMQNKGHIVALDVEEKKLTNLETRAQRAGAQIVETCRISDVAITRLQNKADRLLLDVPCSGLGVLKRNPDAKWKLTIMEIERVRKIQQSILEQYPVMLKKKGIMVYATCSILPSENSEQVRRFLENHPQEFELLEEKQIWPSEGYDGFYMARIQKK